MSLSLRARLRSRSLDMSLELAAGETLALLGPNGAGKSSTLEILAGLLRPDSGRAELDGTTLFDVGSGARADRGAWLAPHRRGVTLLTQDALLFPHLSVLDNVAFAPASAGRGRDASRAAARRWLAAVDAADLESARPTELSGGQAQRVAVARALGAEPRLLLLDEPLASLDAASAPAMRRVLQRVLVDRSAIIVTHEVLDALSLADRVAVVNHGSVVETGPTREVLERPRHPFTAQLAGLNLVRGVSTTAGLRAADATGFFATTALAAGVPAAVAFRPAAVGVHTDPPAGPPNVVPVVITELEPRSDLVRVRARGLFADVTPGRAADLDLEPGSRAYFVVDPADITLYPLGALPTL